MSTAPRLVIVDDKEQLARTVADRFVAVLAERLTRPGDVHVALTGGSVGIATLAAVNDAPARDDVPWDRVHFWWGDERFVPKSDVDRNELQAREALLDHLRLQPGTVHPFPASDEIPDQEAAARAYASELARFGSDEAWPRFDITFLGVGPDGHVASLFPGFPQATATGTSVVTVRDSPKPPPLRLSLTLPVLNSSARVWLVLAGEDKAEPLRRALEGAPIQDAPVAGVAGVQQTVFFADRAAASAVDAAQYS